MEKLSVLVILYCKNPECYEQFVVLLLQWERSQVLLRASTFTWFDTKFFFIKKGPTSSVMARDLSHIVLVRIGSLTDLILPHCRISGVQLNSLATFKLSLLYTLKESQISRMAEVSDIFSS